MSYLLISPNFHLIVKVFLLTLVLSMLSGKSTILTEVRQRLLVGGDSGLYYFLSLIIFYASNIFPTWASLFDLVMAVLLSCLLHPLLLAQLNIYSKSKE